jgi:hypothetical protein
VAQRRTPSRRLLTVALHGLAGPVPVELAVVLQGIDATRVPVRPTGTLAVCDVARALAGRHEAVIVSTDADILAVLPLDLTLLGYLDAARGVRIEADAGFCAGTPGLDAALAALDLCLGRLRPGS